MTFYILSNYKKLYFVVKNLFFKMENVVEFHSEVESEVLNQEPSGHSSNAEQNGIEIFEKNESISDEEINLQFTSSIDSETDGSSAEKPQQFGIIFSFSC